MRSEYLRFCVALLVVLIRVVRVSNQPNCNCVPLKECSPYMNSLAKAEKPLKHHMVNFLRDKQCGFEDGYPKVCCSELPKKAPSNQTSGNTCKVLSECLVLKDCSPYVNLVRSMEKPLKRSVVDFLRSQECGFEHGYPKVCCSLLPKSFQALKHSRPDPRDRFRKLMAESPSDPTPVAPIRIVSTGRPTTTFTTKRFRKIGNKELQEKADAINDAFMPSDYLDFTGSFDLMLRKKRYDTNSFLDIEIR